jgi:hypothetical protein
MDEVIKIALHKEAEKTNTSLSVEKKKKRSAGK